MPRLQMIRSGGQTGADRGALDAAIGQGVRHHGWCPKGRRAEDGPIPARYHLTETPSAAYEQRTDLNVRDSDATVILCRAPLAGGSLLTLRCCEKRRKPVLVLELDAPEGLQQALWDAPSAQGQEGGLVFCDRPKSDEAAAQRILELLDGFPVEVLNVAGNRESEVPGLQQRTEGIIAQVLWAQSTPGEGADVRFSDFVRTLDE